MTTTELVAAVLLKATGKTTTLTSADTKWQKIVAIANFYIDSWQNEPDVDWHSLYDPSYSLGTVSATDTFSIPDEVRKISDTPGDKVRIVHTDNKYTDYDVIPADKLKATPDGHYCAQIGLNLVFNKAFTSTDAQYGGTIEIPAYLFADSLVNAGDEVPVDIPNWLVAITAAEYVRNDVTRQNQQPFLLQEANQLMQRMKDDNSAQVEQVTRPWQPTAQTWA